MSVYDRRMQEIAAQRQAEQAGLDRIEESTETITNGMANPFVYLIFIVSLILIPFTSGLSFAGGIVCLLMMSGYGKAAVQAVQPTTADIIAPGAGLLRILCAAGFILLILIAICLFGLIVYANMEVKP